MTAEDEAALDQVLSAWEERSAEIQRFNCTFTRLDYNYAFPKKDGNGKILKDAQGNIVPDESAGDIKYAAPDKGLYAVDGEFLKERWICDGKSVFEYDFQQKQLIEHPLPPELQGQAIVDGPLPFFFGAEATKLKRRYFLRIVTPPANEEQQIWIEARPRTPADAANFTVATLILNKVDFLPFGLEVVDSSGKKRTVHQFNDCVVNDPWHGLKRDPFKPLMFRGWTKIVEEPPTAGPAADPGAPGRQDQPPPRNAGRPRTPPRE